MTVTVSRDADTQRVVEAIVQALLADTGVTGDLTANGYEGVGTRVYPEAYIAADTSGKVQDFPYLIITSVTALVPLDYTSAYLDAQFDVTAVDRAHTPHNVRGGTENVVGIIAAAYARLMNAPLTVTGYASVTLTPASAPRGSAAVQVGVTYRQRAFTVRVQALKT
jgi:hypothetical protein